MAKEAPAATGTPQPQPKNRLKLLVILLVIVLFVVILGAAALIFLLSGSSGNDNGGDEEHAEQAEGESGRTRDPSLPPVFSDLDDFVVNLLPSPPAPASGIGRASSTVAPAYDPYPPESRFLQVKIVLELDAKEAEPMVKAQMPRIRNNLTALLSNKTPESLMTKAGKEALAEEIMKEINDIVVPPVKGKKQNGPVISVLFNSFLIQ